MRPYALLLAGLVLGSAALGDDNSTYAPAQAGAPTSAAVVPGGASGAAPEAPVRRAVLTSTAAAAPAPSPAPAASAPAAPSAAPAAPSAKTAAAAPAAAASSSAAPAPAAAAASPAPAAPAAPAPKPVGTVAPVSANAPPSAKLVKPPLAEAVLALKQGDWRVRVTVRPGEPQPAQLIELQLDVSQIRNPPDPTFGDEAPLDNAQMVLSFTGPGAKVRSYLRPLGDAGSYGVHWTPQNKGLWTATLAPLAGQGPSVSFEIGVGVPMPASAQGQEVEQTRAVLGTRVKPVQPLTGTMNDLATRWLKLLDAGTDGAREGGSIASLLRSLVGRGPQAFASSEAEFDELARNAASAAEGAARMPAAERPAAMRAVELNSCTRCHVKYRDGVVEDLSHWPEVKPWVR